MKKIKQLSILAASMCLAGAMTFQALGASRIDEVSLELEAQILIGDEDTEIYVESYTDGVSVEDYEVTNAPDDAEWDEGMKPRIKIILEAEGDGSFASGIKSEDIFYDGPSGRVSSVSRNSSKKLTVYITLDPLSWDDYYDYDEDYNLDVYGAEWDEELPGAGYWETCDARTYQVRLYRGEKSVSPILETENDYFDFSEYFTRSGEYTYRVRAARGNNKGEWAESDVLDVNTRQAKEIYVRSQNGGQAYGGNSANGAGSAGEWVQEPSGLWWWRRADNSYPSSAWEMINGSWYYFNEGGYMAANQWIQTNGLWYYCGESGAMAVNTWVGTYYVNADGVWVQ